MAYLYRGSQNQNQKNFCTNCGGNGHVFRTCIAPVTSHGVIMVRSVTDLNIENSLTSSSSLVTGLENEKLQFLLIQRRDSLGFIELIRGRYKSNDLDYIRLHLGGITKEEQLRYRDGPFDVLWNSMWGLNNSHLYKNEFENAKAKWHLIHTGIADDTGKVWTIDDLIATANPPKETPEWGFPKGRRDAQESDYVCAMREMEEETGVLEKEVICINNIEPIVESFFGSNHVHYCHKYFIVWVPSTIDIKFNSENDHMRREIGDIQWFSIDDALNRIRSENIEKKEALLHAASLFRNLCPFPVHV